MNEHVLDLDDQRTDMDAAADLAQVKALYPEAMDEELERITDIYVPQYDLGSEALKHAFFFTGERHPRFVKDADPSIHAWLSYLLAAVSESDNASPDFRLEFRRTMFRAHIDQTIEGAQLALRRLPTTVPKLDDLFIPTYWHDLLMNPELKKGGLIIFAAECGQGKSTLAAATIKSRLMAYGGFSRTIEDPVELPLHGIHLGKEGPNGDQPVGVCMQTPADVEGGYAESLRSAMRSFPAQPGHMLMVGEVRDAETASQLLTASVNGMTCLCTMHAGSIPSALQRLVAMAEREMGEAQALQLLGEAFRLGIWQRIQWLKNGKAWRKARVSGEILYSSGPDHKVAHAIRSGEMSKRLADPLKTQGQRLKNAEQSGLKGEEVIASLRRDKGTEG